MNAPTRFILGFLLAFIATSFIGHMGSEEPQAVNSFSVFISLVIGLALAGRYPDERKSK